jgi:hypothetical protein
VLVDCSVDTEENRRGNVAVPALSGKHLWDTGSGDAQRNQRQNLKGGFASREALRGVQPMTLRRSFTTEEARKIGEALGIDWATVDVDQFRRGLEVELEHGTHDPQTNVTDDDPLVTGKIAWAHLKEIRDYYTLLDKLEAEAKS